MTPLIRPSTLTGRLGPALLLAVCAVRLAAADPAPGIHRLTLGRMEVTCLQDNQFELRASLLVGIGPEEARKLLGDKDTAPTPVNAFLVQVGGRRVLVDTGTGAGPWGRMADRLKAAGVDPAAIDLVLLTHFHLDHVGGLLNPDGTRAFPKAQVCAAKEEDAFWLGDPARLPERLRAQAPKVRALLAPYQAAGAYRTFAMGDSLGPDIRVLPAPGHTPGHTCYGFRSEGREFWCVGDLVHFGAIQFQRPSVAVSFDADPDLAAETRKDFFRNAAVTRAVIAGAHMAFPGVYQLKAKGDGYEATPFQAP